MLCKFTKTLQETWIKELQNLQHSEIRVRHDNLINQRYCEKFAAVGHKNTVPR